LEAGHEADHQLNSLCYEEYPKSPSFTLLRTACLSSTALTREANAARKSQPAPDRLAFQVALLCGASCGRRPDCHCCSGRGAAVLQKPADIRYALRIASGVLSALRRGATALPAAEESNSPKTKRPRSRQQLLRIAYFT